MRTVNERLEEISGHVNERLDEGFTQDQRDLRQRDGAAGDHRRGAEEDRRPHQQRREPAGTAGRQALARRLRRGAARRTGAATCCRPAAFEFQYTLPNGSARRLRAEAARAHRPGGGGFQVPAGELPPHVRCDRVRPDASWRQAAFRRRTCSSTSTTSPPSTSFPARPPTAR
ncbi:MAG: hypothetical protein MZW92_49825 [Comamonadaceae bacterium]|nr:hypothetical protein [Comamonadaceae bacterium]